ncbi:mitochondrial FAD-linked sulfhydryl oxidase [Nematocida sp. LUAm3]|nr:mitochondrial FAD-linked sulfhydryl oxidase [Nematocida sp. LUAm3]KAI5175124.1 mitochondrial FAD-linked sulfhydryl oxidase [Nematocida sp. LUAm2]KAI5178204.1 mitochondrial FAD-linked sulfhydryl oxidase [Nematocida sp. LUAm1]
MRKGILIPSFLLFFFVLWGTLTIYKVMRKNSLLAQSAMHAHGDTSYYEMPKEKEDRRRELGRGTWTLLHTIAAKYPPEPTKEEMGNIIKLIDLLTKIFPCDECRGHFKSLVTSFPPIVSSHDEFATWLCQAHNIVNKRLGKREFDCKRLDNRWDCGCK